MKKISIIWSGNVGASCADSIGMSWLVEHLVLLDVKQGVAEGKSLDLLHKMAIVWSKTLIHGVTNDYTAVKWSDIVVITSWVARKPGMSRDDLLDINRSIMSSVIQELSIHAKDALIIVVSNPVDIMTWHVANEFGWDPARVLWMAGTLDAGRFIAFLSMELGVHPTEIDTLLLWGHGDHMVPLISQTTIWWQALWEMLSKESIDRIVSRTQKAGGEIVSHMGMSGWYGPGAAVIRIVKSIVDDTQEIIPCSVVATGQYGITDCCIWLPVRVWKNWIEEIVEIDIDAHEREMLTLSAEKIKRVLI